MPLRSGGGVKLRELVAEVDEGAVRDSAGIYCTTRVASHTWRLHIAEGLHADDDVALAISTDEWAPRRVLAVHNLLADVSGSAAAHARAAEARSILVHRGILQALDGDEAGASQREIAVAIFGRREVQERWSADGELRARIRYFLRRGRTLVQAEYRKLAYL